MPEEMTEAAIQIAHMNGLGKDVLYCLEENKFYIYDSELWRDVFEIEVMKMITDHVNFKDKLAHAISRRKQIIDNLKVLTQRRLDQFNRKGYLNFDFGEFDPMANLPFTNPSGAWHPHNKENYSTIRIDYPFMAGSTCELWIKTLNEIMEGDQNKINMLQEFFGYCLTRDTTQRKALLLLGESNCGKSTILQVLRAMVSGRNCSSVPLKYIAHPQYTPMLINKLVNIDSDVSAKADEFEAQFKIITSGEPVSCNQKFIATFEFVPFCKVVMAANIFPRITDHSSAFYNRLILIPCDRVFTEREQNKHLFKELTEELFGIFLWATEGLERLYNRGIFEELDFMKDAVQALEDDNNPSNLFFEEHIISGLNDEFYIEKSELFKHYKEWCVSNQHYTLSAIKFSQAIFKKYHKTTPKNSQSFATGKRIWRNIKYVESKESVEEKGQVIAWNE